MVANPLVDFNGRRRAQLGMPDDVDADATLQATGAGGAATTITIPADTARPNIIGQVGWSYSAAPTGGNIKVEDASGTTIFEQDVTAAGPGSFTFVPALRGTKNAALIVTLAAPGGAVVGKVFVNSWRFL